MIIYRVWKDSNKDNWQDCLTEAEAIDLDFGFGFQQIEISTFDIEAYKRKVNEAHEELFRSYYEPLNYLSRDEIALWLNSPEYGSEAQQLIEWYWVTWDLLKQHFDTVTEQTADISLFIDSLPKLNIE